MKKHKGKILVLFLAVLLVSVMSCENPFLKKMLVEEEKGKTIPAAPEKPQLPNPQEPAVPENPANPEVPEPEAPKYTITFGVGSGLGALKAEVDGNEITTGDSVEQGKSVVFTAEPAEGYVLEQWTNGGTAITEAGTDKTYTHTVTANADIKVKFQAPFVEGGASLILSPDKLTIKVKAVTSDGSAVAVEGCTETTLASSNSTYTVLHAKGTRVILKGNIIELNFYNNQLTALNVQGLSALKKLFCQNNRLTALNVQGLTALETLWCDNNQLPALNVQGLTALQTLECYNNQLTALNVQSLTALQTLYCDDNQLTALNVQGLTALKELSCGINQLTALNVQGLTALKRLWCDWNQLTELNVQGCTALKELRCLSNRLNADAFKKLFDDLPVRQDSDDAKCLLYYTEETGGNEGNHTDFTAPPDLKDAFDNAKNNKKWKMYKLNGSWPEVEI